MVMKKRHELYDGINPDPVAVTEIDLTFEQETEFIINERKHEYPEIGDQLDAIWSELNSRRLKGEKLVQEADDMLGEILAVKNKHPKPVKGK